MKNKRKLPSRYHGDGKKVSEKVQRENVGSLFQDVATGGSRTPA